MKRVTLLLIGLLGAMLIFVTACGGEEDTPTPTRRPTATPTPTTAAATPTPTMAADTPSPTTEAVAGVTLEISAAGDALAFDKDKLTASAGAEVVLTFNNVSAVNQHNWVLVQAGTKDDVANDGVAAGPDNDWIKPGDDRVIGNTQLLNTGETGEAQFTAPPVGTYQFLCTFPGHNAVGMHGTFEVTQ